MHPSKFRSAILFLLLGLSISLSISGIQAQASPLSAAVTVIAEGVYVQLVGAQNELPLHAGAVAPLGAGDRVRTANNGRALITFPENNMLLLLPDSAYELRDFRRLDDGHFHLEGSLQGIAVQQFTDDVADWKYTLSTDAITVVEPSPLFAVWAVANRLEAAISAQGTLVTQESGADSRISIPPELGIFAPYDAVVALDAPLHASQLLALSINCQGTVSTSGSVELRLRAGNALDYPILEGLQNHQQVHIAGITDNGLWYRIPFQTGFGWLYSGYVQADCPNLPRYPRLVNEQNEQIQSVTSAELELLTPFYGTPLTNLVFYR